MSGNQFLKPKNAIEKDGLTEIAIMVDNEAAKAECCTIFRIKKF